MRDGSSEQRGRIRNRDNAHFALICVLAFFLFTAQTATAQSDDCARVTMPTQTTATVGTYFYTNFGASGAASPCCWSLGTGSAPPGLEFVFQPNDIQMRTYYCELMGTPTRTGTFSMTVRFFDTMAPTTECVEISATYTLTIGCQNITVVRPSTATGTVGVAFSETFTPSYTVGTRTFALESGSLPNGLTLSSSTGVLSGIPTESGTFPITVSVTDGNGCKGTSATYSLVICPVISVTNPSNSGGTVGGPFSESFTQSGAAGATFTIASGTLPNGLTLSTAGVLSGTPTEEGSFPIIVSATDANGCIGVGSTYTLQIQLPPPVTIAALDCDSTLPSVEGTTLKWTANASGGIAPLQYAFWRQDGGHWILVKTYGASNSYSWTPPAGSAGNHAVEVDVRSTGSTKSYEATRTTAFAIAPAPQISSLAADCGLPLAEGSTVTWAATASNGIAPLQYRFWRQDSGHWVLARDYSIDNTYAWTSPPGSAGRHAIEVDVRSAQSTRPYEATRVASFEVIGPQAVTIDSLSVAPAVPVTERTPLTWTATASGGTAPLQYRFWRQDGGHWLLAKDYGTSNVYSWTPPAGSAGTHAVEVDVRSSASTRSWEATRSAAFTIVSPPVISTITADRPLPLPEGSNVTWTAAASEGIAPLEYRFWRGDSGHWVLARDYSSSSSYSWTPPVGSAGFHTLEVDVRSAECTRAYEATLTSTFEVTVNEPIAFQTPPTVYSSVSYGTRGHFWALAADVNGDGAADLVTGIEGGIAVALNQGHRSFGPPLVKQWADVTLVHMASGDFSGDMRLDIAAANFYDPYSGNVMAMTVFLGNGNGTFNYGTGPADIYWGYYSHPWGPVGPSRIAAGDLDGDGHVDLAAVAYGQQGDTFGSMPDPFANYGFTGDLWVFLGNGTGFPVVRWLTLGQNDVAIGDVNGDGKPDLVTCSTADNSISGFLNNGSAFFARHQTPLSQPTAVATGDFNNDGRLDVVVAQRQPNTIAFLAGNGTGSFGSPNFISLSAPQEVSTADLDGDGKLDVLTTGAFGLAVLRGDGTGRFSVWTYPIFGARNAVAADFDGDGKLDVAVFDGAGFVSVFYQQ